MAELDADIAQARVGLSFEVVHMRKGGYVLAVSREVSKLGEVYVDLVRTQEVLQNVDGSFYAIVIQPTPEERFLTEGEYALYLEKEIAERDEEDDLSSTTHPL